ncbi:MAG: hypothetical protein DRN42_00865 [Thermoplasmata archaeon]|nr:MAG: hypothetical protein DRN42_00865 [Thermoplasmata archaeon]
MVEFEVIEERIIPFGKRNFIEVARKRALFSRGEAEFISIARGYFTQDDERRYRNSVTLPLDSEVLRDLVEAVRRVAEGLEAVEE